MPNAFPRFLMALAGAHPELFVSATSRADALVHHLAQPRRCDALLSAVLLGSTLSTSTAWHWPPVLGHQITQHVVLDQLPAGLGVTKTGTSTSMRWWAMACFALSTVSFDCPSLTRKYTAAETLRAIFDSDGSIFVKLRQAEEGDEEGRHVDEEKQRNWREQVRWIR